MAEASAHRRTGCSCDRARPQQFVICKKQNKEKKQFRQKEALINMKKFINKSKGRLMRFRDARRVLGGS